MMAPAFTGPVRVLVVDDESLFRAGLVQLLRGDRRLNVVGSAVDGEDALRRVELLKPDVVLMDLRMPRLDGVLATGAIVERFPASRVLVLSAVHSDDLVIEALQAGAAGAIVKDSDPAALVAAILAVADGDQVMSGDLGRRVVALAARSGPVHEQTRSDGLTNRQIDILRLMASGLAAKQIARQLGISEKTVRNQSSLMYAKLHIQDRAQAILYAVRKGLVA